MEKCFNISEHGSSVKTEVRAGLATFLTMAYIVVVNPAILSATGMPFAGVVTATVLIAAISSILMGLMANLPFALAPGMGISAFFAFSLVLGSGASWQTALGAVFVSGIVFIVLSVLKVREKIVAAIPLSVRYGVAAVRLFLPFLFLRPLLAFIPLVAGAPIMVLIGIFILSPFKHVEWNRLEVALPAFLAMILIPLTYSITQGIIWAFLGYTAITILNGKVKEVTPTLWVIDLLAV